MILISMWYWKDKEFLYRCDIIEINDIDIAAPKWASLVFHTKMLKKERADEKRRIV